MNAQTPWQDNNEEYLSAALVWLRSRLRAFIESGLEGKTPEAASSPGRFPLRAGGAGAADAQSAVTAAEKRLTRAAAAEPAPAMILLARLFDLTVFEQQLLLLCAAMELDTRLPALCARAQDADRRPWPTFALALSMLDAPDWEAISPAGPLRYWRMIEVLPSGPDPLVGSALKIDERLVTFLKGLDAIDERLTPFLVPFEADGRQLALPPSQQAAVALAVEHLNHGDREATPLCIQLVGPDPVSKQLVVQQAAEAVRMTPYRLPAALLPTVPGEIETLSRLWRRESILLPVIPYLDAHGYDALAGAAGQASSLQRFLSHLQGAVFIGTREIQPGMGAVVASVHIDKPTPAEQNRLWREHLGGPAGNPAESGRPAPAGELADLLAGQFNLHAAAIGRIAGLSVGRHADGGAGPPPDALWDACLASTRPRMDLLAQRLTPKAGWADIVLADETERTIRRIADQVRQRSRVYDRWGFREKMNRGLGISVLFAGESGTGKTMAAEVIARDLKLNLYRIDLAQVVNKYIGETEKNLSRLFDAAEAGGAILFFDEADALFGKRSEVRDSHDRYANIEINYLLQRMEAYSGLAILATNMKSALDSAFMRRLRFVVNFPFPDRSQRRAIWAAVFPPRVRVAPEVSDNLDCLARLHLNGGSIHNVALNAAFAAARDGGVVTLPIILDATQVELRKLERPSAVSQLPWKPGEKAVA